MDAAGLKVNIYLLDRIYDVFLIRLILEAAIEIDVGHTSELLVLHFGTSTRSGSLLHDIGPAVRQAPSPGLSEAVGVEASQRRGPVALRARERNRDLERIETGDPSVHNVMRADRYPCPDCHVAQLWLLRGGFTVDAGAHSLAFGM
jgi:hypothetical protein